MTADEIEKGKAAHNARVMNQDEGMWEEKDRQDLLRILTSPALLKALALQRGRTTQALFQMQQINFSEGVIEGAATASRLQGLISGMSMFEEGLVDLALGEPDEEPEIEEGN